MRILKLTFFLLFVFLQLLVCNSAYGQNNSVKISQTPTWVNKLPFDTNVALPSKEISDGYYVIFADQQVNDSLHSSYVHYVQKIISESGIENGSDISVTFNPAYQNLVFHCLKVIRNGKEINQLNANSFKIVKDESEGERHMYDNESTAQCLLHDIRKGDVIEYAYSINGTNPIFKDKFFQDIGVEFSSPVGRMYYRIVLTKNKKVGMKIFKTNLSFKRGVKGNEYILDISNINATTPDEDIPSWYSKYGYIQFSEFSSWSEYAQWMAEIFSNTGPVSAELKAKTDDIRKKHPDDEDFVLACIHFVQNEIRYEGIEIGENNQRPHPPSQVFSQRFGDCKDKSLLLCTMLRSAGFSADPVLVDIYGKQAVGDWLPSPLDFDHCIAKITLKGKSYWVDPTIKLQGGILNTLSFPDYGLGLVVRSDTKALDTIPEKIIARTETNEQFLLGDTATSSQLTVTTKYYGTDADAFRSYYSNTSRAEIEKYYTNFYAKSYPDISMIDSITYEDLSEDNIITTTEKYKILNAWKRLSDNGWKAEFSANNMHTLITSPTTRIRKTPIELKYPTDFTQTIDIRPPVDWVIKDVETTTTIGGFEFVFKKSYTDGFIHLYYHLKITKDCIDTNQANSYCEKVESVLDNIGFYLTWHPNLANVNSSSSINWIMVFVVILFMLFLSLALFQLYKKDFNISAYRESTVPIGGWLVLVAIGLFLTPVSVTYWILSSSYFNLERWNLLTQSGTSAFNPGLSGLLIFELIGNVFLAVFPIYLLVLFFKKRTSFPKSIIFFYALDLAFVLTDIFLALHVGVKDSIDSSSWNHIIRSIVPTVVWIPYFLVSQRVKETFTQTYKKPDPIVQPILPEVVDENPNPV